MLINNQFHADIRMHIWSFGRELQVSEYTCKIKVLSIFFFVVLGDILYYSELFEF